MKNISDQPKFQDRLTVLTARRDAKMARSAHAYMRGNTVKFYEWLETAAGRATPEGPSIWICGLRWPISIIAVSC